MKCTLFALLLLLALSPAFAQTTAQPCGAKADFSWETPEYERAYHQNTSLQRTTATTYYIPVVFHILYETSAENAPDTFVHSLLDQMNRKFSNTGINHQPDGIDIGIQFCLASKDTLSHPTTGITHDSTPASNMYGYIMSHSLPSTYPVDSLLMRTYGWNTRKYMNIYIVKNVYIAGAGYGGYSSFPSYHGYYRDGFFAGYGYIDPANTILYRYDILAHEAGHYLGLYHTFQFGCGNNNCWLDNDRVCDTPPDNNSSISDTSCIHNSCTTDSDDTASRNPFRSMTHGGLGDQNDYDRNFMDYSVCSSTFTPGQRDKMIAALTTLRASLFDSLVSYCGIHLSIGQQKKTVEVQVVPNPFTDEVRIVADGLSKYTFTLINYMGNTVYSQQLQPVNNISLGHLPAGIYIYRLSAEQGIIQTGKIIKQ